MKNVTKENVEILRKTAIDRLDDLLGTTDMESTDDRKRTSNYYEWSATKTQMVIDEKSFTYKNQFFSKVKRGSVVWVEFGFNIGAEFGGRHPAIVLRRTGSSIFVVPLSSQEPDEIKKHHVKIDKVYGFKSMTRWVNVLKIQNVSLQRVDQNRSLGNVKGKVMDDINDAIKQTHIF